MSLIATVYQSTDPGAPALTGQAGSLINLLRALLVTGYGAGPTTKPGLGWTEAFTATNKAVFRNSPATGSGTYLRVDDSGGGSTGGREALLRAYEGMTSVDAGTGPSPTAVQSATGVIWVKSSAADSASRAWRAIGTERDLFLFVAVHGVAGAYAPFAVFDVRSRIPSDRHSFLISGENRTNAPTSEGYRGALRPRGSLSDAIAEPWAFLLRGYTLVPGAQPAAFIRGSGDFKTADEKIDQLPGTSGIPYPDPVTGGLLAEPILVREGAGLLRGFAPGVYAPLHIRPLAEGTYPGLLPGVASALVWNITSFTPYVYTQWVGQVIFDLANEW